MRDVMTVLGVLAVIAVFAMILRCPDAKENFSKEHLKLHRKSLLLVFSLMIGLLVIVSYLLSHVGM